MTEPGARWARYAAEIERLTGAPADRVVPDALVVGDLGVDSIALVELIVFLADETGISPDVAATFESRDWERTTAEALLAEFDAPAATSG